MRLGNGVVFASVFNSASADSTKFSGEVEQFLVDVSLNNQSWPEHDLFPNYYPGE